MYCQLVRNEIKQFKFISQKIFLHELPLVIFLFYYFISFIISFNEVYFIVKFVFLYIYIYTVYIQALHMPG